MAGTPFSQEIFNTREELVSSDIMQAQNLMSRDVQDALASAVRSIDSAAVVPGLASNFDLLRANGAPISGLDIAPTFTPSAGLTATLGAGSGYSLYATGVASNQSTYQVLRWPSQTITFGTGAGSPRIDTVYAQPAQVVSVTASRNVLVDPVARTVTAQSVNKQGDPLATIGVIAGTPAANPVANASALAAIAGAVPLFYVYVPAGISATSGFGVCRGTWRRAPYPFSGASGVFSMNLSWDLAADPTAASAAITCNGTCRILIDGEILEWSGVLSSAGTGIVADASASPFGSAASAGWNRPYYIYAVGGRHNVVTSFDNGTTTLSPVILVESTIAPDATSGKPSAALNLPAPYSTTAQAGAVYVGLGFVVNGTTRRLACIMDEEWTHIGNVAAIGPVEGVSHTAGSTNYEAFNGNTPMQLPVISRKAIVALVYGGGGSSTVAVDNGAGSAPAPAWANSGLVGQMSAISASPARGVFSLPGGVANPTIWVQQANGAASALVFTAFEHRVRRIATVR